MAENGNGTLAEAALREDVVEGKEVDSTEMEVESNATADVPGKAREGHVSDVGGGSDLEGTGITQVKGEEQKGAREDGQGKVNGEVRELEAKKVDAPKTEQGAGEPTARLDFRQLSPAELIARGRAPVKKEFWLEAGQRRNLPPGGSTTGSSEPSQVGTGAGPPGKAREGGGNVWAEKKSKRQQKRERQQARKSSQHVCAAVARTGDLASCPYGDSCRFNHDLDAFLASKPVDLPGECPFLGRPHPCPYGLACRFYGTHRAAAGKDEKRGADGGGSGEGAKQEVGQGGSVKQEVGQGGSAKQEVGQGGSAKQEVGEVTQDPANGGGLAQEEGEGGGEEGGQKRGMQDERNGLSKETQKQLWKNMLQTPRADKILQEMGLLGKGKPRPPKGTPPPGSVNQSETAKSAPGGDEARGEESLPLQKDGSMEEAAAQTNGKRKMEGSVSMEAAGAEDVEGGTEGGGGVAAEAKAEEEGEGPTAKKVRLDQTGSGSGDADQRAVEGATARSPADAAGGRYGDAGVVGDGEELKLPLREKRRIDFRGQVYLAPLTTVGNLPFRRVCKDLGADITCGEMAMCTNLLQGQASEWALLRRHSSETVFGVQICGAHPDTLARTAEMVERECDVDFIDINMGCPIDLVVNKGAGSCLLTKPQRMEQCVRAASAAIDGPLTVKIRTAYLEGRNCAHALVPRLPLWGAAAVTIHGRSRQQRYSRLADWDYIHQCARTNRHPDFQVIGNGDIFAYTDWNERISGQGSAVDSCMVARGALIKPWVLTEIKEQRHWDISAGERLGILKDFSHYGLHHWGSDTKGVETTRHFLLEWLGYLHRYIPVGLLEVLPQKLNWRPPNYYGRSDLETLLASDSAADWVRISEMLLGPAPAGFSFTPKHKSNAYDKAENG